MKTFFALAALAVACSLATAGATKLLLINNSQQVLGGISAIWEEYLRKRPIGAKGPEATMQYDS